MCFQKYVPTDMVRFWAHGGLRGRTRLGFITYTRITMIEKGVNGHLSGWGPVAVERRSSAFYAFLVSFYMCRTCWLGVACDVWQKQFRYVGYYRNGFMRDKFRDACVSVRSLYAWISSSSILHRYISNIYTTEIRCILHLPQSKLAWNKNFGSNWTITSIFFGTKVISDTELLCFCTVPSLRAKISQLFISSMSTFVKTMSNVNGFVTVL